MTDKENAPGWLTAYIQDFNRRMDLLEQAIENEEKGLPGPPELKEHEISPMMKEYIQRKRKAAEKETHAGVSPMMKKFLEQRNKK